MLAFSHGPALFNLLRVTPAFEPGPTRLQRDTVLSGRAPSNLSEPCHWKSVISSLETSRPRLEGRGDRLSKLKPTALYFTFQSITFLAALPTNLNMPE